MVKRIRLSGFECYRCGHRWVPRKSKYGITRACPKCKNVYWDRPKQKAIKKIINTLINT